MWANNNSIFYYCVKSAYQQSLFLDELELRKAMVFFMVDA